VLLSVLTQLSLAFKTDLHVRKWLENDDDIKENIFIFPKKVDLPQNKQVKIEKLQQSLLNGASMTRSLKRTTVYEVSFLFNKSNKIKQPFTKINQINQIIDSKYYCHLFSKRITSIPSS